MKTAGIVLAAGQSRRFGDANKLLADFKGRPLCSYAALAMRGLDLDHRLVATADPVVAAIFNGFEPVHVVGTQSDSLRSCVEIAQEFGACRIIITLADMPYVGTPLLAKLLALNADIAAVRLRGGRPMVPAVFGKAHFETLTMNIGDQGAKALLRSNKTLQTLEVEQHLLRDIDTVADLKQLG